MAAIRDGLVREIAARDMYASLHRHLLSVHPESEWRTVFGELEAILGYRLPDSARQRRPLWPGLEAGVDYSREAGVATKTTVFLGRKMSPEPAATSVRRRRFSIREILPPHDPGSWPQDFTVSREQIYDDMGRLTGGPEDTSGDDR